MNALSDEFLMIRVKQGELHYAGLLFERYHKKIYNYFYRALSQSADAEDATQNLFTRLLKYRSSYKDDKKFSTWIFSIALNQRNQSLLDRQKKNLTDEVIYQNELDTDTNISTSLEDEKNVTHISNAITKLPSKQRELLSLYLFQELSHKDLAQVFESRVETIRVQVHRALGLLKNELKFLRSK